VISGVPHKGDRHFGLIHAVRGNGPVYLIDTLPELIPVQGHYDASRQGPLVRDKVGAPGEGRCRALKW